MDPLTSPLDPLLTPGDKIALSEVDYRYGVGDLRMTVTHVNQRALALRGLEWVQIHGIEILPGDREGRPRYALVRVAALRDPGTVRRPTILRLRRWRRGCGIRTHEELAPAGTSAGPIPLIMRLAAEIALNRAANLMINGEKASRASAGSWHGPVRGAMRIHKHAP